jgi:hypothetical protein
MQFFLFLFNSFCIENFPPSLRQLNLSHNPCAVNISALDNLKRTLPNLHVILADMSPEMEQAPSADLFPSDNNIPSDEAFPSPVDSAAVLREVVDRKCRLQAFTYFNLADTVKVTTGLYSHTVVNY